MIEPDGHFCYRDEEISLNGIVKSFVRNDLWNTVSISIGRFDEAFDQVTKGDWKHGGQARTNDEWKKGHRETLKWIEPRKFECKKCKHKFICLIDPDAEVLYEEL